MLDIMRNVALIVIAVSLVVWLVADYFRWRAVIGAMRAQQETIDTIAAAYAALRSRYERAGTTNGTAHDAVAAAPAGGDDNGCS